MNGLSGSLTAVLLACFVTLAAGSVHAQADLEQAYAAYLDADFEAARAGLARAMRDPDSSHADLARGHALAAVLASLDPAREGEVIQHVEAALALDADVAVPEGAPRDVAERFERARAARAGTEPGVHLESEGAGDARAVIATLRDVPEALAGSVHLRCGEREASDARRARLTVGSDATACEGEVHTPDGRPLFSTTLALDGAAPPSGGDEGWIILGVVLGVVVVGAAITVGVVVGTSQDAGIGAPMVIGW